MQVLLEMHRKYADDWLVQLLFDDLYDWNTWFVTSRALGPAGIISLGSDTIDGFDGDAAGTMQGARFESGLDNSPMCARALDTPLACAPASPVHLCLHSSVATRFCGSTAATNLSARRTNSSLRFGSSFGRMTRASWRARPVQV